ncbi:hypothetical protein L3V16_20870 [Brucella ciceri]|uniref:hypothetical protein n=1 Tax=Brucella ciceri TaxID=391287 RepID=UPI000EFC0085|nr:hypothetical protein [Brucella ciceri]MCH6206279.1 hypothetical protein [Brucella ciceri]
MSSTFYTDAYATSDFPTVGTYIVAVLSCVAILWTIWKSAIIFGAVVNPTFIMDMSVCFVGAAVGVAVAWLDTY